MNRDKQGTAITDRAPNQTKTESNTSTQGNKGSNNSQGDNQPPTNPSKSKTEQNTTTSSRKSLKDIAQDKLNEGNASQLGDHVSLKAETADSAPTDQDRGAASGGSTGGAQGQRQGQGGGQGKPKEQKSLKEMAESNPSALGDPVSLKNESNSQSEPTEQDRGAMSEEERKKRGSKL